MLWCFLVYIQKVVAVLRRCIFSDSRRFHNSNVPFGWITLVFGTATVLGIFLSSIIAQCLRSICAAQVMWSPTETVQNTDSSSGNALCGSRMHSNVCFQPLRKIDWGPVISAGGDSGIYGWQQKYHVCWAAKPSVFSIMGCSWFFQGSVDQRMGMVVASNPCLLKWRGHGKRTAVLYSVEVVGLRVVQIWGHDCWCSRAVLWFRSQWQEISTSAW